MSEAGLARMPVGWLGMWYAEPLTPQRARGVLDDTHRAMHRGQRSGRHIIIGRLRIMVARSWLDGAVQRYDYEMAVRAGFSNRRARALADIIYGQLLLSRKLAGAFDHLDAGFLRAAPLMTAGDYLEVRRRHALLRRLELGSVPGLPHSLDSLLVEAAVIARLEGRLMPQIAHDPSDTSG
ncbi:MAG: hypothetical protein ACYDHM_03885 [Acidiferrobacterales bacterium]